MKQFKGYEEARKNANYQGSSQLPVGGYVAKVQDVRYEEGQDGNSDRIVLAFDIAEGEYKDFFKKQFEGNTNEDKKWKGKATIYVPKDDGSEKDEWTQNAFARWTASFEDSNEGYKWDWQEKKWKGKMIGVIFGQVGTVIDGKEVLYTECRFPTSVDRVRKGDVKIPNLKKKNGYTGTAKPQGDPNQFVAIPDGIEEEIPF